MSKMDYAGKEELQDYLLQITKEFDGKLPSDAWHIYKDKGMTPQEAAEEHKKFADVMESTKMKNKKTPIRENRSHLSFLIENELEKAELVLAVKSITDKLQNVAESIAKVEADDLLPMTDSLRIAFGSSSATKFINTATLQLRDLVTKISASKDAISAEITNLENVFNGEMANDMNAELPLDDDELSDDELSNDELSDDELSDDDELDNNINAAGRPRKESIFVRGKSLKEQRLHQFRHSKNPDSFVLKEFKRLLRISKDVKFSIKRVAENLSIDSSDVIVVLREAKKAKVAKAKSVTTKKLPVKEFEMKPTPKSKRGMFKDKTQDELRDELSHIKKEMKAYEDKNKKVPDTLRTKFSQLTFALRAKNKWGKVAEANLNEAVPVPPKKPSDLVNQQANGGRKMRDGSVTDMTNVGGQDAKKYNLYPGNQGQRQPQPPRSNQTPQTKTKPVTNQKPRIDQTRGNQPIEPQNKQEPTKMVPQPVNQPKQAGGVNFPGKVLPPGSVRLMSLPNVKFPKPGAPLMGNNQQANQQQSESKRRLGRSLSK